jgi:hypothetical protein
MPVDRWQRAGIRQPKSGSVGGEFRGAHSTAGGLGQHNPIRGKALLQSQRFHAVEDVLIALWL